MNIEPTIIAAIIGAVGAVVAAILTRSFRKKTQRKEPEGPSRPNSTVVANGIHASGDVIISGRDTHIAQHNKDRFMSRESAQLVSRVADEIIRERRIRFGWSSFDARFLDSCFRDTPRGWIFDGAESKKFLKWENDRFFDFGVRVYNEVCKRLGYSHADYTNLVIVEEAYVSARYLLRGLTIMKHPKKEPTIDDFYTLWDGSEPGWCLVRSVRVDETVESFSPIIFDRVKRGALMINDLSLHRQVVERMKKAGISIFTSLEAAIKCKSENGKTRENTDDATAVIHCKCGALIVVSDIPMPPPRRLHVRCKDCGVENDLDLDDFTHLRVDE